MIRLQLITLLVTYAYILFSGPTVISTEHSNLMDISRHIGWCTWQFTLRTRKLDPVNLNPSIRNNCKAWMPTCTHKKIKRGKKMVMMNMSYVIFYYYYYYYYYCGYPGQLARTSTNPMGPKVNDYVSLQWLSY